MKPIWLLLTHWGLIFSFCSASASPLDNWHWRNPLPNGNPQASSYTLDAVVFTNGQFVAVGVSGIVAFSSDGTNWTVSGTATTNTLNGLAYVNGRFLAVGNGGVVETSTDGTNWVLQASGTTASLTAAAYANGRYVAVGGSVVIVSPDAVNWSSAVSGLSGAVGVAGGSAGFVAIPGVVATGGNQVFFSSDGSTWTSQILTAPTSAPGNYFNGPLYNQIVTYANGAYFIGSSHQATSQSADAFIFRSTDGSFWTTNVLGNFYTGTRPFFYNFFMVENATVVAAGYAWQPFYQFSSDGLNWTTTNVTSSGIGPGFSGAYGNNIYAIMEPPVGPWWVGPYILTSSDGVSWTSRQLTPPPEVGPTSVLTGIAYSNGVYVAASSGLLARSTNGLAYLNVSSSPALSLLLRSPTDSSGSVPAGQFTFQATGFRGRNIIPAQPTTCTALPSAMDCWWPLETTAPSRLLPLEQFGRAGVPALRCLFTAWFTPMGFLSRSANWAPC